MKAKPTTSRSRTRGRTSRTTASSACSCGAASGADAKIPLDKEEQRERLRKYRAENPRRVLLHLAKQRANRVGVPFAITVDDIRIPKRCPVLGIRLKQGTGHKRLDKSPTLDRLNPLKGYVPGNVAVISFKANVIKSNGTPTQIRKVAEWVARRTAMASKV